MLKEMLIASSQKIFFFFFGAFNAAFCLPFPPPGGRGEGRGGSVYVKGGSCTHPLSDKIYFLKSGAFIRWRNFLHTRLIMNSSGVLGPIVLRISIRISSGSCRRRLFFAFHARGARMGSIVRSSALISGATGTASHSGCWRPEPRADSLFLAALAFRRWRVQRLRKTLQPTILASVTMWSKTSVDFDFLFYTVLVRSRLSETADKSVVGW